MLARGLARHAAGNSNSSNISSSKISSSSSSDIDDTTSVAVVPVDTPNPESAAGDDSSGAAVGGRSAVTEMQRPLHRPGRMVPSPGLAVVPVDAPSSTVEDQIDGPTKDPIDDPERRYSARRASWHAQLETRPASESFGSFRLKKPGWCVGNTANCLTLLTVTFIIEALLFSFHCTPLMDVLVDEENVLGWLGITTGIRVVAGLVLIPAMFMSAGGIIVIACFRRRLVGWAERSNETRSFFESKSLVVVVINYILYAFSPSSSFFFLVLFAVEVKEMVLQALATEQMSRSGVGQLALTLYTTVILLNGVTPLGLAWVVGRINRFDDNKSKRNTLRRREEASKWISRLLLFDGTCDFLYSFFALGHLLVRLYVIFGSDDSSSTELRALEDYAKATGNNANDLKAFMLYAEGENALYGGKSLWDIVIKVLSRGLPLIQVPLRVMAAFTIRQSLTAGVDQAPVLLEFCEETPTAKPVTPAAAPKKNNANSESASRNRHSPGNAIRRGTIASVKRSAFRGKYVAVPRWLVGTLFTAFAAFSLSVYVMLWTWGKCYIPEINKSCAVRAFPIFQGGYGADRRSCACNTLFFLSENCTALSRTANRSAADRRVPAGVGADEAQDGGREGAPAADARYASEVLGLSPSILQQAANIFVQACPSDSHLLDILAANAHQPLIMQLRSAIEEAPPGNGRAPAAPNVASWSFPSHFGLYDDQAWPLVVLFIEGSPFLGSNRTANSTKTPRDLRRISLESFPAAFLRMTALRSLRMSNLDLARIPSKIGQLTNLKEVWIEHNPISSVPSSFAQLTSLRALHLRSNSISQLPPSFSLEGLTHLERFAIDNNSLTAIPASMLVRSSSSPNLLLGLEENSISLAAMTDVLASSVKASAAESPSYLMLLGGNPACSHGPGTIAYRAGPWQIKCEPECAMGCVETGIGDRKSWIGDKGCDPSCDTESCKWDGGDCLGKP